MKTAILLLLATLGTLEGRVAGLHHVDSSSVRTPVDAMQGTDGALANEYGPWRTVLGYPRLDSRVRRVTYNSSAKAYEWHVEYRNRYSENVYLDSTLTCVGEQDPKGWGRICVRPGKTYWSWHLVPAETDVWVWTRKLRIGPKDIGPYLDRRND